MTSPVTVSARSTPPHDAALRSSSCTTIGEAVLTVCRYVLRRRDRGRARA